MADYLKLAQEAFESSSAYVDANWKRDWEYSLRTFRNEHAAGSKYLSEEYKSRSRIFPPKTRTIIRKNEAAGMQAMFSNREVVNVEPGNPDDMMSVAGAVCIKEVLEYRLSKTIPAFEVYLGGLQDAQTTGTVCSYQYWEYEKRGGKKVKDQPCIELRPIENIRLDGGASWLDPIGTSPYFCDIIPMYVCDVRAMMKSKDKEGKAKWKSFEDDVILKAKPDVMDAIRQARLGRAQDPDAKAIASFDVVWVMRWFMKSDQGEDQTFYSLGTEELLTQAKPVDEVYFHGKRPYVLGYAILETHKPLKSGIPILTRPLQQETADIRNQRLDNVKFVLNKRWIVARGRQVDVQSLVRNVPGGVTLATDPEHDVKESNWPDVTSSAFVEHDRLNAEFDDLAGNFSPSTKVANNAVNDTLGGSRMANQSAGLMTEYMLRTVNETWWEKVLRQLVLLEQYYETDEIVLAVCAQKARLFPRFHLSAINDDLLMQEVNVSVNAGMGNPQERLQKFILATNAAIALVKSAPPGFNVQEGVKEIYSNAGYRDGARFMNQQQDPRLAEAMQMVQKLQGMLQGKQMEIQAGMQTEQLKLASNEKIKGAEIQVDQARIQGDLQIRHGELLLEDKRLQLETAKVHVLANKTEPPVDPARAHAELAEIMAGTDLKIAQAASARQQPENEALKAAAELQLKREIAITENALSEKKITGDQQIAAQKVSGDHAMEEKKIAAQKAQSDRAAESSGAQQKAIESIANKVDGLAAVVQKPQQKTLKSFALKKDGKKITAVVAHYNDGSTKEVTVGMQ